MYVFVNHFSNQKACFGHSASLHYGMELPWLQMLLYLPIFAGTWSVFFDEADGKRHTMVKASGSKQLRTYHWASALFAMVLVMLVIVQLGPTNGVVVWWVTTGERGKRSSDSGHFMDVWCAKLTALLGEHCWTLAMTGWEMAVMISGPTKKKEERRTVYKHQSED